jgi:hypothetical protein
MDDEEEEIPWIPYSPGRPVLYDQNRSIWGFHILHMTGDSQVMWGARQHRVFWKIMYTIDSVIGYTILTIKIIMLAVLIGIAVWIMIQLH